MSEKNDKVTSIIQERINGKHGTIYAEVKVTVVYFQYIPTVFSPYFTLVCLPQTINENNEFGLESSRAYKIDSK